MKHKPTVLAVDDDPLLCHALNAVLDSFGLHVTITKDAESFLKLSDQLRPDLFLIDLQIGEASGFDLIEKIRMKAPNSLIIVMSGSTDKLDIAHALELGAHDFILKPLNRLLLASKLALYLDTDRLHEHQAEFTQLKDKGMAGVLEVDAVIEEIDELGFKLLSDHLISKGTVFKLRSDFFKVLGAAASSYLVSVSSSTFNPETESYSIHVEFEASAEPEIHQLLHRWLMK